MKNKDLSKTVSVIIPIYKVEKYLHECIDSVIGQTYTNLEIILVDDGSPDNCGAICDEYALKDSRICVIHKKNGGLSDARNAGISAAHGKYIYFIDSDDYIKKEAIGELVDFAEQNEADIVFFDSDVVMEKKVTGISTDQYHHTVKYNFCSGTAILDIGEKNNDFFYNVQFNLYKTEFLRKNDLHFKKGIYYEDLLFNPIAYTYSERVFYLKKSFYYYRVRDNSITTRALSEKHFKSRLTCIKGFRKEIKKRSGKELTLALERCILQTVKAYLIEYTGLDSSERKKRRRDFEYLRYVIQDFRELDDPKMKLKLISPELYRLYWRTLLTVKNTASSLVQLRHIPSAHSAIGGKHDRHKRKDP